MESDSATMTDRSFVVTIDGPAGTGKSSVAKEIARELNFSFLDTGAMYRAVGAACLDRGVDPEEPAGAAFVATSIEYDAATGTFPKLGASLRTLEVTDAASRVAQHPAVRETLVGWQRAYADGRKLVTEGRDQGTEVFPDAELKIFLTATPEERAQRRVGELERLNRPADFATVLDQIRARDERDKNRAISPLRPAENAHIIDTTAVSLESVVKQLVALIQSTSASLIESRDEP